MSRNGRAVALVRGYEWLRPLGSVGCWGGLSLVVGVAGVVGWDHGSFAGACDDAAIRMAPEARAVIESVLVDCGCADRT